MKKFFITFPFAGTFLWMVLAGVFCWSQSPLGLSIFSAAVGAILGGLAAYRTRDHKLHIGKVWLVSLGAMVGVNSLIDLSRWSSLPSSILGGDSVYILSDALFWGLETLLAVFLLRWTSSARPALMVLELLTAGAVLVELFEAHRHGFINRPYALVDPLWAWGIDPLPVFLGIGSLVGVLLLTLSASHSPKRGRWVDLGLVALVIGALFLFAPLEKLRDLPPPPQTGQSEDSQEDSERGEAEDGQPQEGKGQKSDTEGEPSSGGGQGGNSDSLSFSDANSGVSQNPPVAVVIFRDDYTPDTGMYYFRQNAFSQYNGTKLVADTSGTYDRDVADEFPGEQAVKPEVPPLDPALFRTLETKVALMTDHAKPFGLTNPTTWTASPNPDPKRFQKAFDVTSLVLDKPITEILGKQAGDPNWDAETWAHYTRGPDDPRYRELLEEIYAHYPEAPKDDPLIRALMVKLWLEENGIYSLNSKHEGSKDPTASFLFGDRTGYCVFFAHAAVYLYRTAGMPARTGSGYAVEASQRGDGSALLIPARSAHSWPEVYLDGLGWVVLDIAPARSLDPPPQPSDPGLQQMLGEMARQNPEEQPPDEVESKLDLQQTLKNLALFILRLLPYLILAGLVLAYGRKAYRRYRPWFCPEAELPRATLRSLLDLLSDAGFYRAQGEPREAFSRRLEAISPSFHRLTRAHLRERLGSPDDRPGFAWKKTFIEARGEIKKSASTMELTKGTLNPISWYWVN
ncbi:MAG: transglutaminase-like domain-containing protein [Vulcanimicrobiota bacterium]